MSNIVQFCIFAVVLLVTHHVHCEMKPTLYCKRSIKVYPDVCVLEDVYVTRDSLGFIPVATNSSNILKVQVKSYKMDVLTSDICNAFPNVMSIDVQNLDIKEVDKDAFENCTKLEALSLQNNSLVTLDRNLFSKNQQLKVLKLSDNPLVHVEAEMFKDLWDLKKIEMQNNHLLDFDAETLRTYFSEVSLDLGKTHILCERYNAIDRFMYNTSSDSYIPKDYCLDSDEYGKELMKVKLTDTLTQLKINFLYKEIESFKSGRSFNWKDWHFYVMGAVAAFLLLLTLVSLILCCKARCELRRQNQYGQLSG